MIRIICRQCGCSLRAPEEHLGKTGKCPKCGAAVKLEPPPTASDDKLGARAVPPPPPPPARKTHTEHGTPTKGRRLVPWIAAAGGAGVVLVGTALLVVMTLRANASRPVVGVPERQLFGNEGLQEEQGPHEPGTEVEKDITGLNRNPDRDDTHTATMKRGTGAASPHPADSPTTDASHGQGTSDDATQVKEILGSWTCDVEETLDHNAEKTGKTKAAVYKATPGLFFSDVEITQNTVRVTGLGDDEVSGKYTVVEKNSKEIVLEFTEPISNCKKGDRLSITLYGEGAIALEAGENLIVFKRKTRDESD